MIQSIIYRFVILLAGIFYHPFHVSVCEIEFNQENESLEIIHKFFLDDMELGLNNRYQLKLDLLSNPDHDQLDELMEKYLLENFKVLSSGKELNWNYLGHEIDDGAIRCYLEAEGVKELTNLSITHSSLLETFDDQQNMVHVYKGELTRSLLLTNGEESGTIRLVD